jgi:hypothetical protein
VDLGLGMGVVECLRVGIHHDKLYAFDPGFNHAINSRAAGTTHADNFNSSEGLDGWCNLWHI